MKLISNLTKENHFQKIKYLFESADKVYIASPFLMTDFSEFLGELNKYPKAMTIVTTLKPNTADQLKKVDSLVSLVNFKDQIGSKSNLTIQINNFLHGKVYIFEKDSKYFTAVISSANFTEPGLSSNHEWGVEISDEDFIKELFKEVFKNPVNKNLSEIDLINFLYKIDEFYKNNPVMPSNRVNLNLNDLLKEVDRYIEVEENISIWLKPVGLVEAKVELGRVFGKTVQLEFSRRPSGAKLDDIFITYAVGSLYILSVVKMTNPICKATDDEINKGLFDSRWPWYSKFDNLTISLGSSWWSTKIFITDLRDKFIEQNPDTPITAVGGKSIGALNWGADKLRLSKEFGSFILSQIT